MRDDVWRFVDGELEPARAREIEAAAARDPALAREIEAARACKRAVLEGAPRPGPAFSARVQLLAARAVQEPPGLEAAHRFLRRALLAAAILAAAGLALLASELGPSLLEPEPSLADPLLGEPE